MNFNNGQLILFKNNNGYVTNIGDIIKKFKCDKVNTENNITEYNIIDNLFINTLGPKNKLQLSKIVKIFHQVNDSSLKYININDDIYFLSNILYFNNKQKTTFIQNINKLENKYIAQYNVNIIEDIITNIDDLELTTDLGYLIGYWLLRGGFSKVDKKNEEYPSWSGRSQDIMKIKNILNNNTYLTRPFKESLELILLIENKYNIFLKNNFVINHKHNLKKLPEWILVAKQNFLEGLLYGIIAANSYISNDSKGNFYLAIKIVNSHIISILHNLFKIRLGLYSRIIGENNHLSFKFNKKLHTFLLNGIENKYISIENFEEVAFTTNKEVIHSNFKIIPWYKFKKNVNNSSNINSYSLQLENNQKIILLANGLFTSC